jgi:hypothetical protein
MPYRYKSTETKRNKLDNRVYIPTIYPIIPIGDEDIFIWTREKDRLDNLAHKYYGDNTLWWIISRANEHIESGNIGLEPGINLRIPMDTDEILLKFEKLNSPESAGL